jgi:hypothetical protein
MQRELVPSLAFRHRSPDQRARSEALTENFLSSLSRFSAAQPPRLEVQKSCILLVDERSGGGDELGPTLEEFASTHQLPPRWLEVRRDCNQFVERADFWYRVDLRDAARRLAVEASDILHSVLQRTDGPAPSRNISSVPVRTR